MSRIRFIEARFFDPEETAYKLEQRFERHPHHLRCRRLDQQTAPADCQNEDDEDDEDQGTDHSFRLVKLGGDDSSAFSVASNTCLSVERSPVG